MSQNIPPLVSGLKEQANVLFRQRSFAEANEIYQSIINSQHVNNLSVPFIWILRSNRAACFIELGEYQSALEELDQIFKSGYSPTIAIDGQTGPIFHKVHFRKAICLSELSKGAEALHELDTYCELVNGQVDDSEPILRAKIQALLTGKSPTNKKTTSNMPLRPFVYEVRVVGEDPILLDGTAPPELFLLHPSPSRQSATAFLGNLVSEHDRFIRNSKPGGRECCICSKKAASLTHTPCMYLHLSAEKGGPKVIDIVQPVCMRLGPCDREARQLIHGELTAASLVFGPKAG